jgi:integrase
MQPSHEQAVSWTAERQQTLQQQVVGEWAEDTWIFTPERLRKWQRHSYLHFTCASPAIRSELKYALWRKFDSGEWQRAFNNSDLTNAVKHINEWLSLVAPTTLSLLEKPLAEWELSLRSYLVDHHLYTTRHRHYLQSSQTYRDYLFDDRRIYLLRQIYTILERAYDERPETERDVWDLRQLGVALNATAGPRTLHFSEIKPLWLRDLAKAFMRYNLAVHTPVDCLNKLVALTAFARFVASHDEQRTVQQVDRPLLVAFISWLVEQGISDQQRYKELALLRSIFKVCVHQLHLPRVSRETLILDADLPKARRNVSRELPEEVLTQLQQHLDALPTTVLRMVVILLECGLRIGELCTLTPDCLICDDKHEWYLRFYQRKAKKEHVIPLVNEQVIAALQAQQQEIRDRYGVDWPWLFPGARNPRHPFLQSNFAQALNAWAIERNIRDRSGKLWRFQSHQFRHTVGMRLINQDVTLEVISRLFGHDSLRMTERYARKRAAQVRAELLRVQQQRRTVDYQGRVVTGDPGANDPDAQLLRKGIRGQTLPVGGCGRLVVLGPCEHANKCLTCPFWLTSTEDLPALKTFQAKAVRLRQRSEAVGNRLVLEQQDRLLPSLTLRIAALEQPERGALTVPDLLTQLRAECTQIETALEESQTAGLIVATKQLERVLANLRATMAALEETR